jgi:hypothetical protein
MHGLILCIIESFSLVHDVVSVMLNIPASYCDNLANSVS